MLKRKLELALVNVSFLGFDFVDHSMLMEGMKNPIRLKPLAMSVPMSNADEEKAKICMASLVQSILIFRQRS